jgi:hypothetical protein
MRPEDIEDMTTREVRKLAVKYELDDDLVDDIARLRRKLIELDIKEEN